MKKIVQFAVQYPVTISMIILGILLLGGISLGKLGVDLFPDISEPRIFIEMKAGERPPEEIEKQYVEGIEAQSIRLKGVSNVSSTCMVGAARIKVEYNWGMDMDEAFLDLQKALTPYSQNSEINEFVITQHDPNASPVMLISMIHPDITDMNELRRTGENYIRNELIRLEGVADVILTGIEEKEIVVDTDPYRLKAYGLTTDNVVQQITGMNRNVSGGSIVEMGTRYIIKGTSLLATENDLNNLVISYNALPASISSVSTASAPSPAANASGRVPVFLRDVAHVSFINKKPENIVRINGKRCIAMAIYKETSYNTVKAVNDVKKSLSVIEKNLPGYQFEVVENQGAFITNAIGELRDTSLIGALFSIVVLFLFLRRIGITFIVSLVLPVSIVATFTLMYFYGLSINIMTLGGLALGAGMLVDNAIVIIENIFRNLETGQNVKDASIRGTTEVGGAIVSSTLTTIVVFLPIVYLHGASGALFKDQAWTVAFSQVASLFVAIVVIPMLFFRMYAKKPKVTATKALRFSWYSHFLNRMLDHRIIVISIACVIIVATVLILPRVGSEYVPQGGTRELSIDIKLKEGTRLQRTEGMVINLETMLKELLGDKSDMIFSQIGSVKSSVSEKSVFQNENTATLKIRLQPMPVRVTEDYIAKIGLLTASIPDAEVTVTRNASSLEATLGTNESPLTVEVTGRDFRMLDTLTQEIKLQLDSMGPVYNLKTSLEQGAPEIDVVIDRNMASIYGLTADNISAQLKDLLMGKNAGKFEHSGEMNDITVRLPELGIGQFNAVMLKGSNGTEVPLYEIANIRRATSPKQLLRNNQNRISNVTADIDRSVAFNKVISDVKKKLLIIQPPEDYQITVTGEEQKRQDAMSNLGFALILSIVLVYMVMASQFESLIHPFTVLLTIPLAGAGSIWAFFILGKSLNIMAYIGIIMLGGIAVNNSILLVDAINQFRGQGHSLRQSIVLAGQNRIRPILMTSLSSILGLLPLTIGFGESAALRSPMAIALIAGLTASTVMSLVVIPCVYYIFDRKTPDTKKT